MIGQGLALDYSSRFASVTLCDTTSITPDEMKAGLKERIETIKKYGMKSQVHTTMKRWFTKRFLGAANPEKEMIRNQILATPTEGTIGCLEAIHNLNYQDRLAQVRLPALILVGENDATTPVAASQAIHERVPDSRMITIPSAGHLANIEQAAVFNKEILRFLLGF
jgi:3-oxoadipate enol-lactonase